eukprot:Skav200363  [mRNA]  locus=scaffold2518:97262:116783:- [translate_table: standard]
MLDARSPEFASSAETFDTEAAEMLAQKAKAIPLTPLPLEIEEAPAKIGRIRILRCFGRSIFAGPHWCCSFVMLSVILAIGCSFTSYNSKRGSLLHTVLGFGVTLASAVSFVACATSNPGILKPTPGSVGGPGRPEQFYPSNGKRHCNACDLKQPAGVLHCEYCQVCIIGWDHHCPWMNKCIGPVAAAAATNGAVEEIVGAPASDLRLIGRLELSLSAACDSSRSSIMACRSIEAGNARAELSVPAAKYGGPV